MMLLILFVCNVFSKKRFCNELYNPKVKQSVIRLEYRRIGKNIHYEMKVGTTVFLEDFILVKYWLPHSFYIVYCTSAVFEADY